MYDGSCCRPRPELDPGGPVFTDGNFSFLSRRDIHHCSNSASTGMYMYKPQEDDIENDVEEMIQLPF